MSSSSDPVRPPLRRRIVPSARWLAPALIIALHGALLARSARLHSPVLDEPGHLAAGIDLWRTGETRAYCVNPPLSRAVAALPVVFGAPETVRRLPPRSEAQRRPEVPLRDALVAAEGGRIFHLMTLARWACLPFSLAAALACFLWGKTLYGPAAGYVALVAWCALPEVLGHGALITPDAASAATGVWAGFAFDRYLCRPTWRRACLAGLCLGLALLAKTTWIILLALWPLLWLVSLWLRPTGTASGIKPRAAGVILVLCIGWLVVNAGYGFAGTFDRLGSYEFHSRALSGGAGEHALARGAAGNRFQGTVLERLPVPFPRDFMTGIDIQKGDFENWSPPYLAGDVHPGGVWYFYLYAALVKLPLGFLILLGMRCATMRRAEWSPSALLLVAVPLTILAVASAMPRLAFFRYLLPAWPFVIVWISGLAAPERWRSTPARLAVALPLAWMVLSSLSVYPHSLSYFNEMAGGPENGHSHLIDNHIDWGQDLLFLKEWYARHHPDGPLYLAYLGPVDPASAGIDFQLPELSSHDPDGKSLRPGWYAISVHFLRGGQGRSFDADGRPIHAGNPRYAALLSRDPAARIGYSILVYEVR